MNGPPTKKPPEIIYVTEFHGRKLAVAKDAHNWIVIRCKSDEDPLASDRRWYFSDPAAMLKAVHKYLIKERIKRLDFMGMAQIVEESYKDVEKLAQRLAEKIADKAG